MSRISERVLVHAALPAADRLLSTFIAANPAPGGEGARVILHAANLSEPAIITVAASRRPGDMTPRYAVRWKAEGGGAFPEFDGSLLVEADEDYDAFWLVIEGAYAPPGGLAGQMFDAVVGNRIAVATTRDLLLAIRDAIEDVFAQEERRKLHPPS